MIYLPTNFSPKNETRNMSTIQIFSAQINGTICTDYQLVIKNNDTNATLYDSTKIHLTTPLYDKNILNHSIPANTITNGLNCKWILTVFENANSVTSGEVFFKTYGNPTVVLTVPSTINSQTHTFTSVYSHPQNISIKKFRYLLYDNEDYIIDESEYFYSSNLTYTFDGFLNNNTYKSECQVIDQNDINISSGKQTFNVTYSQPSVSIIPNVNVYQDKSAMKVTWGNAVQIEGSITGTSSYINDFIKINNKALYLDSISSKLSYNVNIPIDCNIKFKIQFSAGFTGLFCSLGNDDYKIGYDGTRFYFNNKGSLIYSQLMELPTEPVYINIRPTDVFINNIRIGI